MRHFVAVREMVCRNTKAQPRGIAWLRRGISSQLILLLMGGCAVYGSSLVQQGIVSLETKVDDEHASLRAVDVFGTSQGVKLFGQLRLGLDHRMYGHIDIRVRMSDGQELLTNDIPLRWVRRRWGRPAATFSAEIDEVPIEGALFVVSYHRGSHDG